MPWRASCPWKSRLEWCDFGCRLELLRGLISFFLQASDIAGNTKIQLFLVDLCYKAGDYAELDAVAGMLSKKRSIIKGAVVKMVQRCLEWVSGPGAEKFPGRMPVIETIRTVTEGKIYLEVERARVTRILGGILEREQGKVEEAARVMCELQVETFGSLDKREKVDFILEQMRLAISTHEYSKATLISRKVTNKTFQAEGFADLKFRYLNLIIQLALHDQRYLDCSRNYWAIVETHRQLAKAENTTAAPAPTIPAGQLQPPAESAETVAAFKMAIIFAILAPYSNEQSGTINQLHGERRLLDELPIYRELLRTFLTDELIRWPAVEAAFGEELRGFPALFGGDAPSAQRWKHLRERVIEHNIRVIGRVYSTVTVARFAQLLEQPASEAEAKLAELVASGMVVAKVDRTTGVATFGVSPPSEEILGQWSASADRLLTLLAKTSHQIAKEEMLASSAAPRN